MLTAAQIAAGVHRGDRFALEVIAESLSLIDSVDGKLAAWVQLDREGARRAAKQLDGSGSRTGALAGVPVGVKDIFDVAGLPTTLGAAAFAHYMPRQDATVVRRLREAGAIILGKTATTEFAFLDPAPTRNPWNPEHTPGGSSSGSAAAVAAGMVPVALGSQTVGSTLRPAAYCGIVGLKPTHGRLSLSGVSPLAPSLDHPGILSRSVIDAALVLSVVAGFDAADSHAVNQPLDDYVAAAIGDRPSPVLGLPRRFFRGVADDEVCQHIEQIVGHLAEAGAPIRDVEMMAGARELLALGQPVLRAEAASVHAERFSQHKDEYRPNIRGLIEAGFETSAVDYIRAQEGRRRLRDDLCRLLAGVDALLLPVAPTTAPLGLSSTGDAVFCAPASFAGLPAIALPSGVGVNGLPLSVQLVAGPFAEAHLLGVAAWTERVLDFRAKAPMEQP